MIVHTETHTILDLKQALILLDDEGNLEADLCLDLDCRIATDRAEEFLSALRETIGVVASQTEAPLSIGLSALTDSFIVSIIGRLPLQSFAGPSSSFDGFGGQLSVEFVPLSYAKVLIRFERSI